MIPGLAQIKMQSAPAVEGAFASSNETRATVLAGPSGLVAYGSGPNGYGVRVARFAWLLPNPAVDEPMQDFTRMPQRVANFPEPGSYDPLDADTYPAPAGFVAREGQLASTQMLLVDDAAMWIRVGSPMEVFSAGDFFVMNMGDRVAAPGDAVNASLKDGSVWFGPPGGGGVPTEYVLTKWVCKSAAAKGELAKISYSGQVRG